MQDPNRPIGSFIFLGPTGVGKTETARALAEFLFDDERAIVRLDMSEYMEKHAVARMIGAPPGYVGYEEGGQLTEAVRRRPYSVVLFDEIEKAHPDVFNVLLQILDDGRLTDSQGRVVSFRNTVIIMTSNVGSQLILEASPPDVLALGSSPPVPLSHTGEGGPGGSLPWEEVEKRVMDVLRHTFKPEFLNRVDDVIVFRQLTKQDLAKIVELQLKRVERLLADRRLSLDVAPDVKERLIEEGYDPVYGARPLKRVIQREVQNPLALAILEGDYAEGDTIRVVRSTDGKRLEFVRVPGSREGAKEGRAFARP
jgi:ATP-dependent Clp protease ATP-binding subunit ClpB